MTEILTIGEILVEIMTKEKGQKFDETGEFLGPFPSGAPAIFINQVAKIGSSAGIISTIGNDAFGSMNYNKLKKDNVDVHLIQKTDLLTTGVAFVTYKNDGDRDFIFHLENSASSLIGPDDITEEVFENCNYFHIMGSSLFNESIREAVMKSIEICKKTNTKISFDPNIRKELLKDSKMKEFLEYIVDQCHLFLPGDDELTHFTTASNEETAINELFEKGVEHIIVKSGSKGCRGYSKDERFHLESLPVKEVDPTGAGDCFAGTFVSCLNQGMDFKKAAEYANAAGAHAVTKNGPMSGNTTLNELTTFIDEKVK